MTTTSAKLTAREQLERAQARASEVSGEIERLRAKVETIRNVHALRLQSAARGQRAYSEKDREAHRAHRVDLEMRLEDSCTESAVLSDHIAELQTLASQEQFHELTDEFERRAEEALPAYRSLVAQFNSFLAKLVALRDETVSASEMRNRISKLASLGWQDGQRPDRVVGDWPMDLSRLAQAMSQAVALHQKIPIGQGMPIDELLYLSSDRLRIQIVEGREPGKR